MGVTGGDEMGQGGHGAVHDQNWCLSLAQCLRLHAHDVTDMHYFGIVDDELSGAEIRSSLLGLEHMARRSVT
jgi:hypothetical protein